MSAPTAARLLRRASSNAPRWVSQTRQSSKLRTTHRSSAAPLTITLRSTRCLSTSTRAQAGLMPDTHDPQPPNRVEENRAIQQPTELDNDEYHARADEYMDAAHEKAEMLQEAREDVEVDYSAGVLSITLPQPVGTYIINKQPANKQIWLSSPESGPKRFDWVLGGESMDQKEGGGTGDWIYLRDGTSLTDLLRKELNIEVDLVGHEARMNASVDQKE